MTISKGRVRSKISEYELHRMEIGHISIHTSSEEMKAMIEGYLLDNADFLKANCGVYSPGLFISQVRDMPFDVGKAVGSRNANDYDDRMNDSWKWKMFECFGKMREYLAYKGDEQNRRVVMWHASISTVSRLTAIRKKEVKEIEDILLDKMIHCTNPNFHYSKVGGSNIQSRSVRPTWRIRGVQSMRGGSLEIRRDQNANNLTSAERVLAEKFERTFALEGGI